MQTKTKLRVCSLVFSFGTPVQSSIPNSLTFGLHFGHRILDFGSIMWTGKFFERHTALPPKFETILYSSFNSNFYGFRIWGLNLPFSIDEKNNFFRRNKIQILHIFIHCFPTKFNCNNTHTAFDAPQITIAVIKQSLIEISIQF